MRTRCANKMENQENLKVLSNTFTVARLTIRRIARFIVACFEITQKDVNSYF